MSCPAHYPPMAIHSMTGFGRGEAGAKGMRYSIELSSVNRKQADVVTNFPREWAELELRARKLVGQRIARGRVNLRLQFEPEPGAEAPRELQVNRELARDYLKALADLQQDPEGIGPGDLLRAPGVFEVSELAVPAEAAWAGIAPALENALVALLAMREREGAHLLEDIQGRLAALRSAAARIAKHAPAVPEIQRNHLRSRIEEAGLTLDLDDERLLKEVALFAERCDVTEELTRIDSHLLQADRYLASDDPAGRELDFLAQELFREFNTIGSKANHAEISQQVVIGKAEVEKIREQVQNVE